MDGRNESKLETMSNFIVRFLGLNLHTVVKRKSVKPSYREGCNIIYLIDPCVTVPS